MLNRDQVVRWLEASAAVFSRNKDYLTDLDAAIGDADHGINMDRGFRKVAAELPKWRDQDVGAIFKATGMALISSVGGASGPLYGTFFLSAGKSAVGKASLSDGEVAALLASAVEGVAQRGRAQPGDKTMLDALAPAVQAFRAAVEDGRGIVDALHRCVEAAEVGAEATIPMVARKGRASYLGERSAGHKDPGSASACLILRALSDVVDGEG